MFGASRCMFGTNYPVDNRLQDGYWSADVLFPAFEKVAAKYSPYSQQLLWNGTAQVSTGKFVSLVSLTSAFFVRDMRAGVWTVDTIDA